VRKVVLLFVTLLVLLPSVAEAAAPTIVTFAGNGDPDGPLGDGGAAKKASLNVPIDVAEVPAAAGGGFVIADEGHNRIRLVRSGVISTIAGDGETCTGHIPNSVADPCGDARSATAASLNQPTGVAPLADGRVVIADRSTNVIRIVGT
jgi:hypothetical protein